MKAKIHKFEQGGHYILLDINSGAVHVIDKMIYDMMDTFDGANDEAVVAALKDVYPEADLREALGELHELMEMGELFAPDIDVPPTFKQKGLIKSICLMVAQDCNLRCKYCFGDGGSYGQERAVMTPEVGKRAIDFLIESCGPRKHCEVDFFGGEPLMNMKTVKAVTEYARQREKETGKKFKLTMTTNGMLLNDENIKWLNDNDFSLVLSLDGRKEVNDAMRPDAGGHGTYDRIVKNFKKCIASRKGGDWDYRGVYTYLRGTYTHNNMDFTKDVLSMVDEGFNILSVEPVVMKDSPLGFTEEDLPRIREEYDRLTEAYMKRHRASPSAFQAAVPAMSTLPSRRTATSIRAISSSAARAISSATSTRASRTRSFPSTSARATCSTSRSAATAGRASSARAAAMPMPTSSTATSASPTKSAARSRKSASSAPSSCRPCWPSRRWRKRSRSINTIYV